MSVTTKYGTTAIRTSSGDDSFTLPTSGKYCNQNIMFVNGDTTLGYTVKYGSTQIINNEGEVNTKTLSCSGKYMSGNIVVSVASNYVWLIKDGVVNTTNTGGGFNLNGNAHDGASGISYSQTARSGYYEFEYHARSSAWAGCSGYGYCYGRMYTKGTFDFSKYSVLGITIQKVANTNSGDWGSRMGLTTATGYNNIWLGTDLSFNTTGQYITATVNVLNASYPLIAVYSAVGASGGSQQFGMTLGIKDWWLVPK